MPAEVANACNKIQCLQSEMLFAISNMIKTKTTRKRYCFGEIYHFSCHERLGEYFYKFCQSVFSFFSLFPIACLLS